jgi:hypothetical protein
VNLDAVAVERWCRGIAEQAPCRLIDKDGPYLERYELAGYHVGYRGPPIPALYLHRFVASDPTGELHSHPWEWALSLILAGGYREHRCDRDGRPVVRDYLPGQVNVLGPDDRHRIELLGPECWTLFLAGAYAQPWAFHDEC